MPLLTFDEKGASFSSLPKFVNEIKKELSSSNDLRPAMDYYAMGSMGYGNQIGIIPHYRVESHNFERLAFQSDIFMISINALRNRIFKRGFNIESKNEVPTNQASVLNSIVKRINKNNQSLKDLSKVFEQDLNIYDDGYLVALKSYIFGLDGEIVGEKTNEIIRASPTVMAIVADSEGRLGYMPDGQRIFVSISDRSNFITETQAKGQNYLDKNGLRLQPAYYKSISYSGENTREIFYIPGEVFHLSAHNPTMTYGVSPIVSIWMKMVTLIEQDRYLLLNYQKGRPPRGILSISTTNFSSTKASWEHMKEESRKDPHSINPILMENKDGKGAVQWTPLMQPLGDMQFIESRNEMRRAIGAMYGVMPMFSGDMSQSGGLNNEGLQINVTNQAVEEKQLLYNEKVYPWILKQFKITDYTIELEEPEEKDEVIETKIMGVKIDNAVKMSQIGFDVSFDKESEEFIYSEQATTPSDQFSPFGPSPTNVEKDFIDMLEVKDKQDLKDKVYEMITKQRKEMTKEGLKFDIKKDNTDVFIAFITKQLFDKIYENQSRQTSNQINKILLDGITSKDSSVTIINKIKKLGVDKDQAELITRTESAILKNSAREFNFKQAEGSEDFVYKWAGPQDKRTSDISKEIKENSSKGLKLEILKSLVKKTSEKFGFKPNRDWFSHPNQRHFFVRKF